MIAAFDALHLVHPGTEAGTEPSPVFGFRPPLEYILSAVIAYPVHPIT